MSISRFYYIGNNLNLFYGIFSLTLVGCILYAFGLPSINITIWTVIGLALYVSFILFIVWLAYFSFNTYFKLRGHKRTIIINEKSIVFPEFGDSLKIIEIHFSNITELYFTEGRHGIPSNLIIKYGANGHAYVAKDYLKLQDFEAICSLLKKALKLKQVGVK